jgi:glycosyltransferase involved in cell wall biosynthesis
MEPMRILHIVDSLDFHSGARQLQLLGPELAKVGLVEVCCIGQETATSQALRHAGIVVHTLGWSRWFDPSVYWNLRDVVRQISPDVVHVWRLPALRALALADRSMLGRVVLSRVATGPLAWWDRWLVKQVRSVAVGGASDRAGHAESGIVSTQIPLATADTAAAPTRSRTIVCIGKLIRAEGIRHAIWAFDFLRYCFPDARLRIVGSGEESSTLRALVDGLDLNDRVTFVGNCARLDDELAKAPVVWLPRQNHSGRQAALDAMAAGCVVVGSDIPCLRDVVCDGETGFLVERNDIVQMARRTYSLFNADTLCARIGAAAKDHVSRFHFVPQAVAAWRNLYDRIAA